MRSALTLLSFLVVFTFCTAQQNEFQFSNTNLKEVLTSLGQNTDYDFNFDPELISNYSFDGEIIIDDDIDWIAELLYRTPLEFQVYERRIIISNGARRTYRICGTLLSSEDGLALPLAHVAGPTLDIGRSTSNEGNFDFAIEGFKNEVIQISHLGYLPQGIMLQDWDQEKCRNIVMLQDPLLLDKGVVIKDYIRKGISEGSSYGAVNINHSRLTRDHSTAEHDILRTVQLIPGISSIDESATNVNIRGSSPDHNLIQWEGSTLYDPGHLFGMISSINPFLVDQIDVYKGGFDAKYADRIGGMVDISLSDSPSNMIKGSVGTTMTEAHGFLDVPVINDKLSFIISGRHSINDLFQSPTLVNYSDRVFQATKIQDQQEQVDEGEIEAEQILDFYDINAKVNWQPSNTFKIQASLFASDNFFTYNALLFDEEIENTDEINTSNQAGSVKVNKIWSPAISSELKFSLSSYENTYSLDYIETEEDENSYDLDVKNNISDANLTLSQNLLISDRLNFDVGYNWTNLRVTFDFVETSIYEQDYEEDETITGDLHSIFGTGRYSNDIIALEGGMRSTYYYQSSKWHFSPRASIQLALSDYFKLKASGGHFYQFISQLQSFGDNLINANSKFWVLAEPGDERAVLNSTKASAGAIFQKDGWLIDMEGYLMQTDGIRNFSTTQQNNLDVEAPGSAEVKGLDLLIHKKIRNHQLWCTYSLSENRYNFSDLVDESFPAPMDQLHRLSLAYNYRWNQLNFSLKYQYKTGLPYTLPTSLEELDEDDDIFYEFEYERINGQRLPDYRRWDLGISYNSTIANGRANVEASLSIVNLLNRENIFSREFLLGDLEEDIETPEILVVNKNLLKRTPLFMIRVYW